MMGARRRLGLKTREQQIKIDRKAADPAKSDIVRYVSLAGNTSSPPRPRSRITASVREPIP
jgi:hypothetical protein